MIFNKIKGQVWYTDFMIGTLIFVIVLISYFYYVEHDSTYTDDNLINFLISESKSVGSYLISEGYPSNWTAANVSIVGLTDGDYRIDSSKLSDFNSWSYAERGGYLHTTKEYYFYFEYLNGTKFNQLCEDSPGCVAWNESKYLVQHSRLVIFDGQIVKMILYLYQNP